LNDIGGNSLLGIRKKIAKFLMRTFTYRSIFLYDYLALYWSFSSGVGIKFAKSSSQWEARAKSEEMSQTLLSNQNQGNLY
jgi:hypothetical protein